MHGQTRTCNTASAPQPPQPPQPPVPFWCNDRCSGPDSAEIPVYRRVVGFPVVAQRQIPNKVVDVLVVLVVQLRPRSPSSTAVACAWLVSLVFCSSRCGPFSCRLAQDACHHGRYGSEGQLRGEIHVDKVVDVPVVRVVQISQAQDVEVTVEIPQLQFVEKSLFPEVPKVQFNQTFRSLGTAREVLFQTRSLKCPLVCNFLVCRQKTAEFPQVQFIVEVTI